MEITGKQYELVDGRCDDCAFVKGIYDDCSLDVGQMQDEESCFSVESTGKIYKEIEK